MLKTIYLFEIKKLFLSKVNLAAMAGVAVIVVFLAIASASQDQPVSRRQQQGRHQNQHGQQ